MNLNILQIVTLVSPEGAYGGPLSVALNQSRALIQRGHRVTLAGGYRGYPKVPTSIQDVPARLFRTRQVLPRIGFAGSFSPGLTKWLFSNLRNFDVVHIHMARDLTTLPAGAITVGKGVPLVVQTHGMIDPSEHPLARPLDKVMTRRVLRRASHVLYLTPTERAQLLAVGAPARSLNWLRNGVPAAAPAQAPTAPAGKEALFVARIQERKRPLTFAKAAAELAKEFPDWRFTMYGPDEGLGPELNKFLAAQGNSSISWRGPLDRAEVLRTLRSASIYVLPSVREPYPMAVLEAMAVGVPVVVTTSCGLADAITDSDSGIVVDHDEESLTSALRELIVRPDLRTNMGKNAARTAASKFDMAAVATSLEDIYYGATVSHHK